MTFSVALVALAALSSLVAGLLLVGDQSLVGLSGELLSPGRCLAPVLATRLATVLAAFAGSHRSGRRQARRPPENAAQTAGALTG
jgi:hypothetical protein